MKVLIISLALMAFVSVSAAQTPVRQCSNGAPLPLAVQVNSCTKMPCDMWKGYDSNMIIQFVANRNSITQLRAQVNQTTLGIQIAHDLDEERSDVCDNLMYGAICPLYNGEDVTYKLLFPVGDHQPEVRTKVEVSLVDTIDHSVVSCFVVDARIRKR